MTSGEFTPSTHGTISGQHTDIVIDDRQNELREYLDTVYGPTTLYTMPPEGLHDPVKYASLEFHKNESDDLRLFANTTFESQAVNHLKTKNWQRYLSRRLKEIMIMNDHDIYELPHLQRDFYAKLDDLNAVHVQFGADTTECSVTLQTERLTEINYASGGSLMFFPDPDEAAPPSNVQLLHDFCIMWSYVLDTITDELGASEQAHESRPKIVVAAPVSQRTAPTQPDESFTTESFGINPPEVELDSSDEYGFGLIGGLTDAKQKLGDIAELFSDPVGSYKYGLSPQHFVLHGPPGTGKTSLVRAFANELGASLETVRSVDIISKWVGDSARKLDEIFSDIKSRPGNERIVLFFDEFEALARAGQLGTQERVDVKKLLNQEIDDITAHHKNIIFAAATNADIDDLEPSLVRPGRIEPISAGNPNETERIDVWAAVLARSIISLGGVDDLEHMSANVPIVDGFIPYDADINPVELARHTDGYNGAHFETMLQRARMKRFRQYKATHDFTQVTHADLMHEIATYGR